MGMAGKDHVGTVGGECIEHTSVGRVGQPDHDRVWPLPIVYPPQRLVHRLDLRWQLTELIPTAMCVIDPVNPYAFLEVRGRLVEVIPDPEGAFYPVLGARYGNPDTPVPPDAADRVILVMSIEHVVQK